MASREEEKRRLREARLAAEKAATATAARQRRLRAGGGALLVLLIVVAVVIAVASGGGKTKGVPRPSGASRTGAAIPQQRSTDLKTAASSAGCQLRNFPNFGQQHTTAKVTYKSNPPTSGPHDPVPASDGSYAPNNPPAIGNSVHALEHGRIEIQWKPGLPRREISQLQTLFGEQTGYHALLFANQTHMPYQLAATAWQHYLGCPRFSPKVFDAIRTFRKAYTDKAPERIP